MLEKVMSDSRTYLPLDDPSAVLPILNDISIFGGLTPAHLELLFEHLLCAELKADDLVFKEGTTASELYIIMSGQVKIVRGLGETPFELVAYGVGQCFGETSAIGILPHSASAVVTADTRLLMLPTVELHEIAKESPDLFGRLMMNIAREACRRLHKTSDILMHYAEATSRGKAPDDE